LRKLIFRIIFFSFVHIYFLCLKIPWVRR
jgi:hypothetical protein